MKKLKNILVKASVLADFYVGVFGALAWYLGFKSGLIAFWASVIYAMVFLYANSTLWEAKYEQRRKKEVARAERVIREASRRAA